MENYYNTLEGVLNHTNTLENVHKLVRERHIAGYDRKERLEQFIIFGKYVLDTCGNCGTIIEESIKDIPIVIKYDNYKKYSENLSYSFETKIGPNDKVCPVCRKSWGLHNIDDVHRTIETELIKYENTDGKTIKEILEVLNYDTSKRWFVGFNDEFIKNKKYIDLTPWKEGADYPKNKHGWIGKRERPELDENYILEEGDELHCFYYEYYHKDCFKNKNNFETENKFRKVFKDAGIVVDDFENIENEYCKCILCSDWFKVETLSGVFEIGWRKRVINIKFSGWKDEKHTSFTELFKDENVTVGKDYIHAWGYEKATEYLKRIAIDIRGNLK